MNLLINIFLFPINQDLHNLEQDERGTQNIVKNVRHVYHSKGEYSRFLVAFYHQRPSTNQNEVIQENFYQIVSTNWNLPVSFGGMTFIVVLYKSAPFGNEQTVSASGVPCAGIKISFVKRTVPAQAALNVLLLPQIT